MVKAKDGHVSDGEEIEEVEQSEEVEEVVEEEYEIEAILDAKPNAFLPNKLGYFVKWKGYDETENSWVSEEDASNAQDLIDEYWERVAKNNAKKLGPRKSDAKLATASAASQKRLSPDEVESVPAPPKKRGRPPKEKPAPESEDEEPNTRAKPTPAKRGRKSTTQSTKKGRDSNAMDEDVPGDYTNMRKWRDSPSWEHLVHHIDTVERTDDGKLYCYFQLTKQHNDRVCREETSLCRQKMPNMLFDFYERNLRWRPYET